MALNWPTVKEVLGCEVESLPVAAGVAGGVFMDGDLLRFVGTDAR